MPSLTIAELPVIQAAPNLATAMMAFPTSAAYTTVLLDAILYPIPVVRQKINSACRLKDKIKQNDNRDRYAQ